MIKTYNLFKTKLDEDYSNFTNEQLAKIYQKNRDQLIVAEIFCRNFSYWNKLANTISFISNEDKVSIILEKIDSCLKNYTATNNASLMTYAYASIYNAFGELKIKRKYKDREQDSMLRSFDSPVNSDDSLLLRDFIEDDATELNTRILKLTINTDSSLTPKEKLLCNLIIDNPVIHMNEISEEMKVTTQYVWLIRKRLAKKLKVCLCIDD